MAEMQELTRKCASGEAKFIVEAWTSGGGCKNWLFPGGSRGPSFAHWLLLVEGLASCSEALQRRLRSARPAPRWTHSDLHRTWLLLFLRVYMVYCMVIYNETATAVIHFDSLSLTLTVDHAPTSHSTHSHTALGCERPVRNPDAGASQELSVDLRLIHCL